MGATIGLSERTPWEGHMGEGDDRILVEEVVDHIVNALGHAAAA